MSRERDESDRRFFTTVWSLVGRAGRGSDEEQRQALDQLVRRYQPALRAHLIHNRRLRPDVADDLLQQFLLKKVIERDLLNKVEPGPGKFRYFLVTSLNRFCVSEFRHARAGRRFAPGGVPIDRAVEEAGAAAGPHDAFDVAWARQLLTSTIENVRSRCQGTGRADVWDVCQGRLLGPLLEGADPVSYDELVARHGLLSPEQAGNLLVTAKRMFRKALRDLIAEYEPDEATIDEEVADLMRALSAGKADGRGRFR